MVFPRQARLAVQKVIMRKKGYILFYLLLLLGHIALVWLLPYFPTQDGPSHIYNLAVLKSLLSGNAAWDGLYVQDLKFVPNLGFHIIAYPLLFLFEPQIVEKLFITIYLLLMAGTVPLMLRLINRPIFPSSFMVFPAALSYGLAMGFYSYIIALPLVLLAGSVCWLLRDRSRCLQGTVITILTVVVYCFHVIAAAYLVILVFMQQFVHCRGGVAQKICRSILILLPSALPFAHYTFTNSKAPRIATASLVERLPLMVVDLLTFTSVYFSKAQVVNGVALILMTYIFIRVSTNCLLAESQQAFGGFCAAMVLIYILSPASFGGGSFFKERLPQIILLGLIPLFSVENIKRWQSCAMLGLVSVCFAVNVYAYSERSMLVKRFMALSEIPFRGKKVIMAYMPHYAERTRVDVLAHVVSYYALKHNLLNAGNYETQFGCFAVKVDPEIEKLLPKPDEVNYFANRIDFNKYPKIEYVLSWGTAEVLDTRYFDKLAISGDVSAWVKNAKHL